MKYLATKRVQLAKVKLPGDIGKRRKSTHAAELAQSFKMLGGGPAHFPVYDTDGNIVVGRDRMAALLEMGVKTTEVRVVKGSPDELKALELWENLGKRPEDRDALISELVIVTERMLTSTQGANTGTVVPEKGSKAKGRKKTTRGAAREVVAAAAGIDPESVRKAEVRHAAVEREEAEEAAVEARHEAIAANPDAPHVHAYDLNSKERGVEMARQVCACGEPEPYDVEWNRALDDVLHTLKQGLTHLKMLQPARLHKPDLLRYTGELTGTIASLELRRLVAPCPMEAHAKGAPCVCDGLGWVSEYQRAAIPATVRPRAELKAPARGSKKGGAAMVAASAAMVAAATQPETKAPTTGAAVEQATAPVESTVDGVTKVDPPSGSFPGLEAIAAGAKVPDDDIWTPADKPADVVESIAAEVEAAESAPADEDDF